MSQIPVGFLQSLPGALNNHELWYSWGADKWSCDMAQLCALAGVRSEQDRISISSRHHVTFVAGLQRAAVVQQPVAIARELTV
jgi:hypothetical protein